MKINEKDPIKRGKMCAAIFCMVYKKCKISSRFYQKLKVSGNCWIGRHHSNNERNKVRKTMTPSDSSNPRVWVCKQGLVKYILKTKLNDFLNDGWELGRVGYKPRKGHQGRTI